MLWTPGWRRPGPDGGRRRGRQGVHRRVVWAWEQARVLEEAAGRVKVPPKLCPAAYHSAAAGPLTNAQIKITGPAASVMTVRVAVTQKLRERVPTIAAVQLV